MTVYLTKLFVFNPLSANPTKWSNTLKQFVGKLQIVCVFDHFVGLALKGLTFNSFCHTSVKDRRYFILLLIEMAEESHICSRVSAQLRFRALPEFHDMDVPQNVTLLSKVAIFFV